MSIARPSVGVGTVTAGSDLVEIQIASSPTQAFHIGWHFIVGGLLALFKRGTVTHTLHIHRPRLKWSLSKEDLLRDLVVDCADTPTVNSPAWKAVRELLNAKEPSDV